MHQPYYREGKNGSFNLPWVYLHGIKDYTDMAKHLENNPEMSSVVNFSSVLLEQLDHYVEELKVFHSKAKHNVNPLSDPLLSMLAGSEAIPSSLEAKKRLFEDCKRCYAPRMVEPYPAFQQLLEGMESTFNHSAEEKEFQLENLQDQKFYDLVVWHEVKAV